MLWLPSGVDMSNVLNWAVQPVFEDYFYADPQDVIEKRTVFREEYDYFVLYGGRGSAKTMTAVDAVVVEASLRPCRILATREYQNSIDESVKAEIEDAIHDRGLDDFFTIYDKSIRGRNGTKFIFKGLKNNIGNLKSIADVDIVLCEEAEGITKNSWDKLLPSIRPKSGRPIVVVVFNPEEKLGETYQRWAVNPPPRTISRLINFRDNKYFPDFLERQRQTCLKTRPKSEYNHIWEGKPIGQSDMIIIDLEWVEAARFASRHPGFKQVGDKRIGYDPAGQGKDSNAVAYMDGNILKALNEWLKSDDLRVASETAFGVALEVARELVEADRLLPVLEQTNEGVRFTYDVCGGFGDGVAVFISDAVKKAGGPAGRIDVTGFDAGSPVVNPDDEIYPDPENPGKGKTWGSQYTNAKAQGHAILADRLYKTYRFVVQGDTSIDPKDLISIDIEDDDLYLKLAGELSAPFWVKSLTTSKKKVEAKKDMVKRGIASPNLNDSVIMCVVPKSPELQAGGFTW